MSCVTTQIVTVLCQAQRDKYSKTTEFREIESTMMAARGWATEKGGNEQVPIENFRQTEGIDFQI